VERCARANRTGSAYHSDCYRHQSPPPPAPCRSTGRNIINSDQILNMPEIPKTFIVVGGGVIGWNTMHVRHPGFRA